tara:strand:- start:3593 stop:4807 length:1215 start_codon:yes stop_codon:yes gene_type:complete
MTTPSKPADFIVNNASGSAVREDLNDIFGAIRSNNGEYSGEPSTKYKYMWYADSVADKMSFYQADAQTKIGFISLNNGNFFGPTGTATTPSYTFTGDASTGFFNVNSGSDLNQIRVANAGGLTATFKSQLFELAGNIYMQHPNADTILQISSPESGKNSFLDITAANQTYTDYGLRVGRNDGVNAKSFLEHRGTADFEIKTSEAAPIVFTTENLSRFQITASGSFVPVGSSFANASTTGGAVCAKGFGTRTGVDTDSGNSSTASESTANLFNVWYDGTPGAEREYFYIDNSRRGYFQYGTSDYRIKREIADLDINGIERVKKLRTVSYKRANYDLYKASEDVREGFIAHEVGEVIPDACKIPKDDANLQQIEFLPLIATLTKALQEAVAKIETLEAKVAVLEGS